MSGGRHGPGLADALKLLQGGKAAAAAEMCRALLARAPSDPALHQLAATIALQAGDHAGAARSAAAALALRPDHAPTLLVAGHAARGSGTPAEALALFRRAATLAPAKPEPSFMACVTLLELGDGEARTMLDACLQRFPDDGPGWREVGTALLKADKPDAALAAFTRAARAAPTAALHLRRGAILQGLGRFTEAAEAFAAARALEPESAEAALQLGLALRRAGDLHGARAALRTAVAGGGLGGRGWFALGLVEQDRKAWPAAVAAYRQALDVQPDLAEAAVNLGIALQQTGDMDAARDAYGRALRLRPDTFGRIAQALSAAPTGELWLDLEALRRSLAA